MMQGEETQAENTGERAEFEETEATGKSMYLYISKISASLNDGGTRIEIYGILNNDKTEQSI